MKCLHWCAVAVLLIGSVCVSVAEEPAQKQQAVQQFVSQPVQIQRGIAFEAMPTKRGLSMQMDYEAKLVRYELSLDGSAYTASSAALQAAKLTAFVQKASGGKEVAKGGWVKEGGKYLVSVAIQMPSTKEKVAIAPMIAGLRAIKWKDNCPMNTSWEIQGGEEFAQSLKKPEAEEALKTTLELFTMFGHDVPLTTKASELSIELKDAKAGVYIGHVMVPESAFQQPSQISLIQQPFQIQPTSGLFLREQGS